MTRDEFDVLVAEMQAYWPGVRIEDLTIEAWFPDVAELPAEIAREAFHAIARDGVQFPPTGGQIRKRAGNWQRTLLWRERQATLFERLDERHQLQRGEAV